MAESIQISQKKPKAKPKAQPKPQPRVNLSTLDPVLIFNQVAGHRFAPSKPIGSYFGDTMSFLEGLLIYLEENPHLKIFYGYHNTISEVDLEAIKILQENVSPLENLKVECVFNRKIEYLSFEGLPTQDIVPVQTVVVSVTGFVGLPYCLDFIKGSDFKKLEPFEENIYRTSFEYNEDFADDYDNVYCSPEIFERVSSDLEDDKYYYCGSDSFCQFVYYEGSRVSPLTFYAPRETYFLSHFLQRLAHDGLTQYFHQLLTPRQLNSAITKI